MRRNIKYKPKNDNIQKLEKFVEIGFIVKEEEYCQEKKEIDFNLIINKELNYHIGKFYKIGKLNKERLSLIFRNISPIFYCKKCDSPKEYSRYDIANTLMRGCFSPECLDCKSYRTRGGECTVRKEIYKIRCSITGGFRNYRGKRSKRTTDILGCGFDYFIEYIKQNTKFNLLDKNVHLDHIVPVSLATTLEEVYALNHYSNFELLSAIDNRKKGNRFVKKESLDKLITLHYDYGIIEGILKRSSVEIQLLTI